MSGPYRLTMVQKLQALPESPAMSRTDEDHELAAKRQGRELRNPSFGPPSFWPNTSQKDSKVRVR
jgi:hypothetical protein